MPISVKQSLSAANDYSQLGNKNDPSEGKMQEIY
jgi:hypothetical protein